ncbi:hypothetical protein WA158_007411 [Blastocystis sp. Blastoise]
MDTNIAYKDETSIDMTRESNGSPELYAMASPDASPRDSMKNLGHSIESLVLPETIHQQELNPVEEGKKSIKAFLTNHTAYDVMSESGKLIVFNSNVPLDIAYSTMYQQNLLEALIWDSNRNEYIGILTSSDLLKALITQLEAKDKYNKNFFKLSIGNWRTYMEETEGHIYKFEKCIPRQTIYQILYIMNLSKIHRMPIIDEEKNNALCILNHVDICSFLVNNFQETRRLYESSILDANIGTYDNIVIMQKSETLYQALKQMMEKTLSAIPIVDESGHIIFIFQRNDIYKLSFNSLDVFFAPLEQFFSFFQPFSASLVCRSTDSIHKLFSIFADTGFQRLICIDNNDRPMGIVSLVDLFRYFVPSAEESSLYDNIPQPMILENTISRSEYSTSIHSRPTVPRGNAIQMENPVFQPKNRRTDL